MSDTKFIVRKAAVLGAGVMGAQIAAHLIDARVPTVLFDLPAKEGDKNGIVKKAIEGLKKLQPTPLAGRDTAAFLQAANYDEHLALLGECDLVIEAIAERMDWKQDLYRRIAPHLAPHAIFASNTSGLSINALAEALAPQLRPRFSGVHFFNPPRYMRLVEIIPCKDSLPGVLDDLERFLVTTVGKGVIRAKDTPNFVANRVGVFSMLATICQRRQIRHPLRRRGRPDRAAPRPAEVGDLPHGRRRGSRHLRPRREDHAGHPPEGSLARLVSVSALAHEAHRGRRARRQDPERHLSEEGQDGTRPRERRARGGRCRGRSERGRNPEAR